jgi:hypothetical protein
MVCWERKDWSLKTFRFFSCCYHNDGPMAGQRFLFKKLWWRNISMYCMIIQWLGTFRSSALVDWAQAFSPTQVVFHALLVTKIHPKLWESDWCCNLPWCFDSLDVSSAELINGISRSLRVLFITTTSLWPWNAILSLSWHMICRVCAQYGIGNKTIPIGRLRYLNVGSSWTWLLRLLLNEIVSQGTHCLYVSM